MQICFDIIEINNWDKPCGDKFYRQKKKAYSQTKLCICVVCSGRSLTVNKNIIPCRTYWSSIGCRGNLYYLLA